MRPTSAAALAFLVWQASVQAANVPVAPRKLIVVDKLSNSGRAKVVYLVKDPAIAKGTATGEDQISAHLHAGGTGRKLACKGGGSGDASCAAAP